MTSQATKSLRNLYFTRTVVQIIWAVTTIVIAAKNPTVGATLLILYPLWDVACTLYDLKTSAGSNSATTQYVNAAVGTLTAIGIGLTAYSHPPYAVAIFGGWALLAGLFQFAVGILRRQRLGGQWAMILSGLQSTAAGVAFVLGGLSGKFQIKDLGGYAIFGAIYFLVGGILLSRNINAPTLDSANVPYPGGRGPDRTAPDQLVLTIAVAKRVLYEHKTRREPLCAKVSCKIRRSLGTADICATVRR